MKNKIRVGSFFSGCAGLDSPFVKDDAFEIVNFCEVEKHPSAVLKYHHPDVENLGDIEKVNVKNLKPIDVLLAGWSCFRGDTLICTTEGHKPISDIVVGDYVLTHKNRFKRVYDTMTSVSKTFTVKSQGVPDTVTTSEHPYLTISKTKGRNSRVINNDEVWLETEKITRNNFVGMPILQTSIGTEYSDQELWLMGRFVADGFVSEENRKDRPTNSFKTTFCIGYKKEKVFDEMIKDYPLTITKSPQKTAIKYIVTNKEMHNLYMSFGKGAKNKKFPQWILDLPKERLKIVLNGYSSGDGYLRPNGRWSLTSISKVLMMQLSLIVAKVYNVGPSFSESKREPTTVIEGRTVNQSPLIYSLEYKEEKTKQARYHVSNKRLWLPFRECISTGITEKVYNFSVEEDESYVANNCIVHNCKGVSTQGKQEGKKHLKTGLVDCLYPIIKQTKPSFIILENVKNLLSKDMEKLYNEVKNTIEKQGYYCYTEIKDSSKYGTSQQRLRVIMYFVRKDFKEARKNYIADGSKKHIKIKSFTRCLNKKNKYISWSKSHRTNKNKETGEVTKHLDFRIREDGLINTLTTGSGCVGASTGTIVMLPDGSTRYLTPEEGEGLQTWAGNFTKYGVDLNGKKYLIPEGARYEMIGNGVPSNIIIEHKEEIKFLMGLK